MNVPGKKRDDRGIRDQSEALCDDGIEHRRLLDEDKKHAFTRSRRVHEGGEHDVRGLSKVPFRRHLGAEIGEHCNRAQQPPEIFVGRCHSFERAIGPRAT